MQHDLNWKFFCNCCCLAAGLQLWTVIFARRGKTGFVEIMYSTADSEKSIDRLKMLLFLVLNCLVSVSSTTSNGNIPRMSLSENLC